MDIKQEVKQSNNDMDKHVVQFPLLVVCLWLVIVLCLVMRKPAFCISAFVFTTQIVQYPKPSSVVVHPGLCGTWSETPKTGFLTTRL